LSVHTLLDFAVDAAQQAGRVALGYYRAGTAVDRKPDSSPVTAADREAEQLLRRLIADRFPSHSILGEEFGADDRDPAHRWILDPIDGTKSFIHQVPLWGVLVGLMIDDVPSVGVAHFPALGETFAAARGTGGTWSGGPLRVSATDRIEAALLVYTDGRDVERKLGPRWPRLRDRTALQRGWGDCYGHCLVASGRADIALDPHMNVWDCAALIPILQEAGGTFTDWQGRAVIDGGDAISTNGRLKEEVIACIW
jgi:histidinol phosphatase-like enzyme (inositol monophosphatase family)